MSLLNSFEGFTIWSDNYKELAKWYEETFELKRMLELNQPGDYAIAFEINPSSVSTRPLLPKGEGIPSPLGEVAEEQSDEAGEGMMLWIGFHSEVHGKSKDPFRQMISYWVDDVYKVAEKLKEKDVEIIGGPALSPTGDLHFLTARDPELNLIQMFSKA